jgi:hypothetical protein
MPKRAQEDYHTYSTSALQGSGQRNTSADLHQGKKPRSHSIRGEMGPRPSLDGFDPTPPCFEPRTAQPVTSSYTDYAMPAPSEHCDTIKGGESP